MKYAVSTGSLTTEFATYQEAESYVFSIGYNNTSIAEFPDDIVPDHSGSIEVYEQKIQAGYPIPNSPYILALEDKDRVQFSGMLVLVNELLSAGYITPSTSQSIRDQSDNIVNLTTAEFKSLMLGYGIYYKTVWNACDPKS